MIELYNISIDLGEFHLRDINLQIREGEYMALLGPTGAGKTVLVECIVGIHKPADGRISVGGHDVLDLYPEERNIGYVPQDYALFPNMTVKQNVGYGLRARKASKPEIRQKVQEMMDALGIAHLHYRLPLNLSGGERQRVALGRALITKPQVLLLDEPLSALDENLRSDLAAELRRIQRAVGGTFLHVCHSFEEAADVSDRIAIMNEGTIAQVGTIDEVLSRPANFFVAQFTRTRNFFDGIAQTTEGGCRINLGNGITINSDYGRFEGPVSAAVRPEDIEILNGTDARGPGVLVGRVAWVRPKPTYTEMFIDSAVPLVVHEGRGRHRPQAAGRDIAVRIPPLAVKVFPKETP
jgi:molybdate/tungstate transport system ATP-binding protein